MINFLKFVCIPLAALLLVNGVQAQSKTSSGKRQVARKLGTTAASLGYYEYLPPNYASMQKCPVILYFQGTGNGTSTLLSVTGTGIPLLIKTNKWPDARPFVVISPQLSDSYTSYEGMMTDIHNFIDYVITAYKADPEQIYLTGWSFGGNVAWSYLEAYTNTPQNQVAAIFPAAGYSGVFTGVVDVRMSTTPSWSFLGGKDLVWTRAFLSQNLIATAPAAPNLDVRFTVFEGTDHGTTPVRAYEEAYGHRVYDWLLSKRKVTVPTIAAGYLQFALPSCALEITETNASAIKSFKVIRVGGSSGAVSVNYSIGDSASSATSSDYLPATGTLSWASGDMSVKTINVTVKGDAIAESTEVVNLILGTPTGGAALGTSRAELTIYDDDAMGGVLEFKSNRAVALEGNAKWYQILTLTRLGNTSGAVSVAYSPEDGSAKSSDDDFDKTNVRVTWADGESGDKSIGILILGDTRKEDAENLSIPLHSITGHAVLGGGLASTAELKLTNDDPNNLAPVAPTIVSSDSSNTVKATHSLGDAEIEVSIAGGAFVSYLGTITVGNVNLPAGHYNFRTRAVAGRIAGRIGSSAAFTIAPSAPLLSADDTTDRLEATSPQVELGIEVSENGATYATYDGLIMVGNVARPSGYWKFRTKKATGYANSSIVSSPAFTEATQVTFDNWIGTQFTSAELADVSISGGSADPDLDGMTNLVEYALGTGAKLAQATPAVQLTGSTLILDYSLDSNRSATTIVPEISSDLTRWTTQGLADQVISTSGSRTVHRASIPLSDIRQFLRLAVTGPAGTSHTKPSGIHGITIEGGADSYFSVPLMPSLANTTTPVGVITGITASSFSNALSVWTPGEFARSDSPFYVRITSGAATGHTFLITANTTTQLSVAAAGLDPSALGIESGKDTYEICPALTIEKLFGVPSSSNPIVGGSNVTAAVDRIYLLESGQSVPYYYNSSNAQWRRNTDIASQNHKVLLPGAALYYSRNGNTSLQLSSLGRVPDRANALVLSTNGESDAATFFPIDQTLGSFGLERQPGWKKAGVSGISATSADKVYLFENGAWVGYHFNATASQWRRGTLPLSQNCKLIPSASGVLISRTGTAGKSVVTISLPYILND